MDKPDSTKIVENIAKRIFRIETLETRNRDALDFHDVSVWQIKDALTMAYKSGLEATAKPDKAVTSQFDLLLKIKADLETAFAAAESISNVELLNLIHSSLTTVEGLIENAK